MTDVVVVSDSDEEMPEPKRQKLGILDELDSSDDDDFPVAEDSPEEDEVSSSDQVILISSSEDEMSEQDRYTFCMYLFKISS